MVTPDSLKEREDGVNPFMIAVAHPNHAATKVIMEKAQQLSFLKDLINTPDDSGFTPLMLASRRGSLLLAKELIEAGADVEQALSGPPSYLSLTPKQKQELLRLEQEVKEARYRYKTAQAIFEAEISKDLPTDIVKLIVDQLFPGGQSGEAKQP